MQIEEVKLSVALLYKDADLSALLTVDVPSYHGVTSTMGCKHVEVVGSSQVNLPVGPVASLSALSSHRGIHACI